MKNRYFWKTSSRIHPINLPGPACYLAKNSFAGGGAVPIPAVMSGDIFKIENSSSSINGEQSQICRMDDFCIVLEGDDQVNETFGSSNNTGAKNVYPVTKSKEKNDKVVRNWLIAVKKVRLNNYLLTAARR